MNTLLKGTAICIPSVMLLLGPTAALNDFGPAIHILVIIGVMIAALFLSFCVITAKQVLDKTFSSVRVNHTLLANCKGKGIFSFPGLNRFVFAYAPKGSREPKHVLNMQCVGTVFLVEYLEELDVIILTCDYKNARYAEMMESLMDKLADVTSKKYREGQVTGWSYPILNSAVAELTKEDFPYLVRIEDSKIYIKEKKS